MFAAESRSRTRRHQAQRPGTGSAAGRLLSRLRRRGGRSLRRPLRRRSRAGEDRRVLHRHGVTGFRDGLFLCCRSGCTRSAGGANSESASASIRRTWRALLPDASSTRFRLPAGSSTQRRRRLEVARALRLARHPPPDCSSARSALSPPHRSPVPSPPTHSTRRRRSTRAAGPRAERQLAPRGGAQRQATRSRSLSRALGWSPHSRTVPMFRAAAASL